MLSFEYYKPYVPACLDGAGLKIGRYLVQVWLFNHNDQVTSKINWGVKLHQIRPLNSTLLFNTVISYEAVPNLRYGQTFFVGLIVARLPEPEAELENGVGCDVDRIGVQYRLLSSLLAHFCKMFQQQTLLYSQFEQSINLLEIIAFVWFVRYQQRLPTCVVAVQPAEDIMESWTQYEERFQISNNDWWDIKSWQCCLIYIFFDYLYFRGILDCFL